MKQIDIKSLLSKLTDSPGVYKFKDKDGSLLYVGKAKNLTKRVQTYFRKNQTHSSRTKKMLEQVHDIEWIEVGSDLEAILLETNLIKEAKPKYNILMRDDKNHVYIKITKESFPRILIVRKVLKDGAKYFGPKTASNKCKKTLGLLQKLFMYRSCDLGMEWDGSKVKVTKKTIAYPCLDYHIKRCAGPCIDKISPQEYQKSIDQIIRFLEGKTEEIEDKLKVEMQEAVAEKKFEKAVITRDKLFAIQDLMKKQIISSSKQESMDAVSFILREGKAYFNLFQIRDGKLINQENFIADAKGFLAGDEALAPEVLESFLFDYYSIASDVPALILIPIELLEESLFPDFISNQVDARVEIHVPKKGDKEKLIELSTKNAESFFKQERARFEKTDDSADALESLKSILSLSKIPRRIEAYDISHLSGTDTVASMVVFENGKSKKSDYRKFKLRSLKEGEIDDFKSMGEILSRRLAYFNLKPAGAEIKSCAKKYLPALLELLISWDEKKWTDSKEELTKNIKDWVLAIKDNKVIGALRLEKEKDSKFILQSLFVMEEFREKGVARALLKFSIKKQKARRIYISINEDKHEFYEKLGFEAIKSESFNYALNPNKDIDESFQSKPDLIVIDGGKGQLGKAVEAMEKYSLQIPIISLAKREEDIYLPGKSLPLLLPKEAPALKLLQNLRDEAHRFAIGFQKQSRKKDTNSSLLDKVPGIGSKNKIKLLRHFGSLEHIKQAKESEISQIIGVKASKELIKFLQEN